jgi:hypothetical protein
MRKTGQRHNAQEVSKAAERARTWLRENGASRRWHRGSTDREAIDQFLILSHGELPLNDQAAYIGLSAHGIKARRRRLYREGRIVETERANCPTLEETDREEIRRLYANGYSQRAIAAMRQIGPERVRRLVKGVRRAPALLMTDIERIFGVSDTTAGDWVRRGWLPEERTNPENSRSHYRFTRADLFEFAANRHTWPAWQPAQVNDPELRAFAELQRQSAGARWWSVKELALYWGVTRDTMHSYISWGYLSDAGERRTTYGRACYYWFREPPPITHQRPAKRRRAIAAD